MAYEVVTNRSLWASHKLADQVNLRSEVFLPLLDEVSGFVSLDEAQRLADELVQQAKANDALLKAE